MFNWAQRRLTAFWESLVQDRLEGILVQPLSRTRQCPQHPDCEARLDRGDRPTNKRDAVEHLYNASATEAREYAGRGEGERTILNGNDFFDHCLFLCLLLTVGWGSGVSRGSLIVVRHLVYVV